MPKLNGVDTLRELRARGIRSHVVICSKHQEAAMVLQCLEAGVNAYVQKPFRQETLLRAMEAAAAYTADPVRIAIERRRLEREDCLLNQADIDRLFEDVRA